MTRSESSPRVLASFRGADRSDWPGEIERLQRGGIDGLHLDVMDGRWVKDKCFVPKDLSEIREAGGRHLDVHLLVEEPDAVVDGFLAERPDRLSFHVETARDTAGLLAEIRAAECQAGIVVLPSTPLTVVEEFLDQVDCVNPLGVDAPRGTGFDETTFERIATLVTWRARRGLDFAIVGDGGVWEKTRDRFVAAGADELVGGHPIFSADDYGEAIQALRGRPS